jgi:Flp pilus assembly pilin Flp
MEIKTKIFVNILKFYKDINGAAAVEFALLAPLLFAMVAGTIDIGWLQYQKTMLQQIVREGASATIAGIDPETAMSSIISVKRLSGTPTISISCLNNIGSIVSPCVVNGGIKNDVVTVDHFIMMNHSPVFSFTEKFGIAGNISDNLKVKIR